MKILKHFNFKTFLTFSIIFLVIQLLFEQPAIELVNLAFLVVKSILTGILFAVFYPSAMRGLAKYNFRQPLSLDENEVCISQFTASLRRNISLGGVLFLTDKRVVFQGSEFFDRGKALVDISLNSIGNMECSGDSIEITEQSGRRHTILIRQEDGECFVEKVLSVRDKALPGKRRIGNE